MLPMGISLRSRASSSAVRVITIFPSGHDFNALIERILDDIIHATIEGIPGRDPSGQSVRIFLDPVTFLGDYRAVTAMTDSLVHTATAFCTLCSIPKRARSGHSRVLYTAEIHSRRMAFCRFKARVDAIRSSSISTGIMRKIGLTGESSESSMRIPLVRLERILEYRKGEILKTSAGGSVVSGIFNAAMSTAAAPGHLISDLIKNSLTFCFKIMDSDTSRKKMEIKNLDSMK